VIVLFDKMTPLGLAWLSSCAVDLPKMARPHWVFDWIGIWFWIVQVEREEAWF
jgi:hypothetical protein